MTEKEQEIREKAEKFLDDRYDLTGSSSIVYVDAGAYVDFALSCVRDAVREQKEKDCKIICCYCDQEKPLSPNGLTHIWPCEDCHRLPHEMREGCKASAIRSKGDE